MSFPYAPISSIVPWTQAIAGLNQSIFSTNWTANEASDILVYSRPPNIPTSDILQLVPANQYSVQFIGADNIVQITFGSAFIPQQYNIITIMRATPSEFINLYNNSNFTPSMLNGDFETLTLVDQQNQLYWQQIVPRYNNSASVNVPIDTILPVLGANQFWIKNSSNTAFVPATLGSGGGEFPVLGPFVLYEENAMYPNGFNLGGLVSGLLAQNSTLGISSPFVIPFPLDVPDGGTGQTSFLANAVVTGGNTNISPLITLDSLGAAGQVLTSSGVGLPPSWQTLPPFSTMTSNINQASAIPFTVSTTPQNLTSLTLPAGNWTVFGNLFYFVATGSPAFTIYGGGINSVSNTLPDISLVTYLTATSSPSPVGFTVPGQVLLLSVTTTIYLVGFLGYISGSPLMCGNLYAIQNT